MKYSFLARKLTRRRVITGRKSESLIDRWLLASSAPPSVGMFSAPVTLGVKNTRNSGRSVNLTSQ